MLTVFLIVWQDPHKKVHIVIIINIDVSQFECTQIISRAVLYVHFVIYCEGGVKLWPHDKMFSLSIAPLSGFIHGQRTPIIHFRSKHSLRGCIYVRLQKWTVLSVRLSLRINRASAVCCEPVGLWFSRLCVRAAGAVRPSRGVRARSWNHPNPLLQLQHLLARRNQSEGRAWSRDESACAVIFSGDPGGGAGTKADPHRPETLLLHPPSPSSPQPSGFDILDPCVEE